jgi:hypothetical protein
MGTRKHIPERALRAATIIAWLELPHEIAKAMTEDEIIGLVEYHHHPVRKADGGEDVHYNLQPMLRADHKVETKKGAADMAKERKVRRATFEHVHRMALKAGAEYASKKLEGTPASGTPEEMLESFRVVESWPESKRRSVARSLHPKRCWPSRPFPRRVK